MSRNSRPYCLILAAALMSAAVAHADLSGAQKAYAARDFPLAFQLFQEIAQLGNLTGQENVAAMYVDGEGVARDNVLGFAWATIARENGGNAATQNIIDQLQPHLDDKARARIKAVTDQFGKAALAERLLPAKVETQIPPPGENCRMTKPANPDDSYPDEAKRQGISGTVYVTANIGADGRAHHPYVMYSVPEKVLDDAARMNAFATEFAPKRINGAVVPCRFRYLVKYRGFGSAPAAAMDDALIKMRKFAEAGDPLGQVMYALLLMDRPNSMSSGDSQWNWFLKAAQAGVPFAQYVIGVGLAAEGSTLPETEQVKGFAWLKLAAAAGQPDAKYALANYTLIHEADGKQDPVVFAWLEDAVKAGHRDATLTLAALLAVGPDTSRRDPARAIALLQSSKWNYGFDPTAQEIIAAAHAQASRFDEATKAQKAALKLAKGYGWDVAPLEERLSRYQSGTAWTGNLLE
jgi:uncharacterized protein